MSKCMPVLLHGSVTLSCIGIVDANATQTCTDLQYNTMHVMQYHLLDAIFTPWPVTQTSSQSSVDAIVAGLQTAELLKLLILLEE